MTRHRISPHFLVLPWILCFCLWCVRIHGASFDNEVLFGPELPVEQLTKMPFCIARKVPIAMLSEWKGREPAPMEMDRMSTPSSTAASIPCQNAGFLTSDSGTNFVNCQVSKGRCTRCRAIGLFKEVCAAHKISGHGAGCMRPVSVVIKWRQVIVNKISCSNEFVIACHPL